MADTPDMGDLAYGSVAEAPSDDALLALGGQRRYWQRVVAAVSFIRINLVWESPSNCNFVLDRSGTKVHYHVYEQAAHHEARPSPPNDGGRRFIAGNHAVDWH